VAFEGGFHLDIEAIIRSQEIRANQEQDNVRLLEIAVNFLLPQIAGANLPVIPAAYETLPLQQFQMLGQFVADWFVAMRIGAEQLNSRRPTPLGSISSPGNDETGQCLSPVGDLASTVESASAAYFGITVAPHEYFDQTMTGSITRLRLLRSGAFG
jgi:hypothetical protein